VGYGDRSFNNGEFQMSDYETGYQQFRKMVGEDQIGPLVERFKSIFFPYGL
jgi:hypothetical protein